METFKKILKVVAIITAIVAAVVGIYLAVSKIIEKKKLKNADDRENYVSCSCFENDAEPIVAPEVPVADAPAEA